MDTTLNQSKQSFLSIGLVNEFDLIHESCEIKVKDASGNDDGTREGERIRGKIGVRINNSVKTFDVFCSSLTSKGEESKQWKNALSWLELVPEINSTITKNFGSEEKISIAGDRENASLVSVSGRVSENRYYNSNTNDVSVTLRWNATRISTSRVTEDDEHGCTLSGNFFIKSISPEIVGDNETGRLKVCLVSVGYGASLILIDAIVDENLAEDFQDIYEVGQTASFDLDVVFEHVGAKKETKKAFGKSGSIKSSGYDREMLIITGGDEPIEEPDTEDEDGNVIDNGYLNPKTMKKAFAERDKALAEIKENGGNSNSNTTRSRGNSLKEKKKLGTKKNTHPIEDDDPFDDDDDDF